LHNCQLSGVGGGVADGAQNSKLKTPNPKHKTPHVPINFVSVHLASFPVFHLAKNENSLASLRVQGGV